MLPLSDYMKHKPSFTDCESYFDELGITEPSFDDHRKFIEQLTTYAFYSDACNESLLHSYDYRKLRDVLVTKFGEYFEWYLDSYDKDKSQYMIAMRLRSKYAKTPSDEILQTLENDKGFIGTLNTYNYFVTYIDSECDVHGDKYVYIEPNIPNEVIDKIYNDCGGIIYHVTHSGKTLKNILRYGLKPKTARYRMFGECVFFFYDPYDTTEIKGVVNADVCLTIDLNLYKNRCRFFDDDGMNLQKNFPVSSVWTSEYIPPYCIVSVDGQDTENYIKDYF